MRARALALASRAGFTLIELLIVVGVTTIGFIALFDLQASTLRGMQSMTQMGQATQLAENFIEQLKLEFSAWTPTQPLDDAALFPNLGGLNTSVEASPGEQTDGEGGADMGPGWTIADTENIANDQRVSLVGDPHPRGFNAGIRQAMIEPEMEETMQPFCMLYRLTWLIPNRAIRAEVEVSWPLDTADLTEFRKCEFNAANRLDQVRSITLTSTIMVNLFNR